MLGTCNAGGPLRVRLEGGGCEGGAPTRGIHAARYRGERLLIATRAPLMRRRAHAGSARVGVALLDGKPSASAAAVGLPIAHPP